MKILFRIWMEEYKNIFSDVGVMLIFFGAIIVYSIFYPLPYAKEVLKEVPISVVDHDFSKISRQLIRMAENNESITVESRSSNLKEAQKRFFKRKAYGIVVIPEDFSRLVLRGEQAAIEVYADAGYLLIYRQIMTGMLQASQTLSAKIEVKRMLAQGLSKSQAMTARDPLPLAGFPLFNPAGGYASYVVPAVLVLILQQTLLIGIGMLGGTAREQNSGCIFDTGVENKSALSLVIGKSCAYLTLYLVHAVYYFGILHKVYNFPQRGTPLTMIAFILPFLLSVIFLGIAISSLFRSRETSMIILGFTSIPAIFLIGFSWPAESIPVWLRHISVLLPSTAGVDGFLKVNQMGASINEVRSQWLILWGLAVFYFVLAYLSVKWLFKINTLRKSADSLSNVKY